MKTLLRLDASSRKDDSVSRGLADYYEELWRSLWPEGKVLRRDLAKDPIPHLDESTIQVFYTGGGKGKDWDLEGIAWSDRLIGELTEADSVLVSSALYNFGPPSALKAWVDHVVRFGFTIEMGEKGVSGMLGGKQVCLLSARGGSSDISPDFQIPLLRSVFGYMGIREINCISIEGTRAGGPALERRLAQARNEIDAMLSEMCLER